jgi:cyclic-di-GMP phosphodiesterase TipF (flagellum assembly factor)
MSVFKTYVSAFLLVVASFAVGLALWNFAGLSTAEAALAIACLLLGVAQLVGFLGRDTHRDRTLAQLNDLTLASSQAARDIGSIRTVIGELQLEVSQQDHTATQELNSQFQVLETLVKQLAEQVSLARRDSTVHAAPAANGTSGSIGVAASNGIRTGSAQLVEQVRRSLENNRVDLYLQPVVTLPQRKTRYYEALTRLRDADGQVIMPSSYLEVAEHAGIMPMIDNLLLFRCVKVLRRLIERNREIGVFCNISTHSLLDAEFFPHFLEFMQQNQELAGSMLFEFAQSTVQGAGALEVESMALLHEMGFRFSMDHVVNLDMDMKPLADRGFKFIKVEAATLIDGGKGAGAQIHSADLGALARRHGIGVIVEKIETEHQVVTLLDYQIGLGQGFLFSEPRLVREEIIDSSQQQLRSRAV